MTDNVFDFGAWVNGTNKPPPAPQAVTPAIDFLAGATVDPYTQAAIDRECAKLAGMAPNSGRNHQLNTSAFNLASLVAAGKVDRQQVTDRLVAAARACGLDESEILPSINSGFRGSSEKVGARIVPERGTVAPAFTIDPGENDSDDEPEYTDFAAVLANGLPDPPAPDLLTRTDGIGIFYRGKRNDLFGDPEDGKTMVALAALARELAVGGNGLFLDLDGNGPTETAQRLLMLGAPRVALIDRDRFRHIQPDTAADVLRVVQDCAGWATLVIIDCVGELLPLFRASSDSADDYTRVMQLVSKPLEHGGAAVILLDHQAKGAESRQYGAGGTMAKRRALGGVSINLVRRQTFTPGKGGMAELWVNKDRPGGLRRHCAKGEGRRQFAGTFILDAPDPDTGIAPWRVTPERTESPTETIDPVVERHYVAAATLRDVPVTVSAVAAAANGLPTGTPPTRSQKETARRSLTKLVEQGRMQGVEGAAPAQWEAVA